MELINQLKRKSKFLCRWTLTGSFPSLIWSILCSCEVRSVLEEPTQPHGPLLVFIKTALDSRLLCKPSSFSHLSSITPYKVSCHQAPTRDAQTSNLKWSALALRPVRSRAYCCYRCLAFQTSLTKTLTSPQHPTAKSS